MKGVRAAGGHAWQRRVVHGSGGRACVQETATEVGGMHPTRMHSC